MTKRRRSAGLERVARALASHSPASNDEYACVAVKRRKKKNIVAYVPYFLKHFIIPARTTPENRRVANSGPRLFEMPTTRYTHAVVCRLPRSLVDRQPTLDYDRAKRQHENYVRALRDIGLDVIEMPADEETPWCAFVDDTAFVCNGTAIITKPAEPDRAKEVSLRPCKFSTSPSGTCLLDTRLLAFEVFDFTKTIFQIFVI